MILPAGRIIVGRATQKHPYGFTYCSTCLTPDRMKAVLKLMKIRGYSARNNIKLHVKAI